MKNKTMFLVSRITPSGSASPWSDYSNIISDYKLPVSYLVFAEDEDSARELVGVFAESLGYRGVGFFWKEYMSCVQLADGDALALGVIGFSETEIGLVMRGQNG